MTGFNKRIFRDENLAKLGGLMTYLFKQKIDYCVSYGVDDTDAATLTRGDEKNYKATVTWFG